MTTRLVTAVATLLALAACGPTETRTPQPGRVGTAVIPTTNTVTTLTTTTQVQRYRSCADAQADGAAPLHRDGDGTACE